MKKLLSLALASALVLALSAVALATSTIDGVEGDARLAVDGEVDEMSIDYSAPPGETVYYILKAKAWWIRSTSYASVIWPQGPTCIFWPSRLKAAAAPWPRT